MEALLLQDATLRAQLYDLLPIENQLKRIPARFGGVDVQTETFFETDRGKLKWRQGDRESFIMHYERTLHEGHDALRVFRYDMDPSEEDLYDLRREHRTLVEMHKTRQIYHVGNLRVYLDVTPTGESFVEIEAPDPGRKRSYSERMAQCDQLRNQLGISETDLIPFAEMDGLAED